MRRQHRACQTVMRHDRETQRLRLGQHRVGGDQTDRRAGAGSAFQAQRRIECCRPAPCTKLAVLFDGAAQNQGPTPIVADPTALTTAIAATVWPLASLHSPIQRRLSPLPWSHQCHRRRCPARNPRRQRKPRA